MSRPIIAIDADGVLVDYNTAYAGAWERAFGSRPQEADPTAYLAINRWDVPWLDPADVVKFRTVFDFEYWSTIPAMPGAIDATKMLYNAGYELTCVSAVPNEWAAARLQNLHDLGMPIRTVFGVDATSKPVDRSPKADILAKLKPVAFIDDYLPYFNGVTGTHRALLDRSPMAADNPKKKFEHLLSSVDSTHANLFDFACWWVANNP